MKKIIVFLLNYLGVITLLNSQSLTPLGGGVTTFGTIYSLEYDAMNNNLFAGGYFKAIDGVMANNFAMWDGSNWYSLNANVNGPVLAMKMVGNDLYIGGYFSNIGGMAVNNIAKWDGTSWAAVGTGVNYVIRSIESFQGKIYVTGNSPYVANGFLNSWDGSSWSPNLVSFNYPPYGLIAGSNELIVYGNFSQVDSVNVQGLITYTGSNWNTLATVPNYTNGNKCAILNDTLFLANGGKIYKYTGTQWLNEVPSVNSGLIDLFSYNNSIYAVQDSSSGNNRRNLIKKISQNTLQSSTGTISGFSTLYLNSFCTNGPELFIGGDFDRVNKNLSLCLLKYNGNTWSNIGKPSFESYIDSWKNTSVTNLYKDSASGELYIGGSFYFAGHKFAPYIAKWNGTTWTSAGDGFNGVVNKILKYNNEIYAFGSFTKSGTSDVKRIAKWNGTHWVQVGLGANGTIFDAVIHNGNLFVAGRFDTLNGINAKYIAQFNGSSWYPVGSNMLDTYVGRLAVNNGQLFAGALLFPFSQNFDYSPVVTLNGNIWELMQLSPISFNSRIHSFINYNGNFYFVDDQGWNFNVYMLNGVTWNQIDQFGDGFGRASFFVMNNELYIGCVNNGLYKFNGANFNFISDLMPLCIYEDVSEKFLGGFMPWIYLGNSQYEINNIGIIDFTLPQVSISANKDSICDHEYVFYYSQTIDVFAKLKWYFPGGIPDTLTNHNPIIQYQNTGTYPVYVIATNMVGSDTIFLPYDITVTNCILNVDEFSASNIVVYPNPFQTNLIVNSVDPIDNIVLTDITGKIVMKQDSPPKEIEIKDKKAGIYFLIITQKGKIIRKKIIKL